MFHEAGGRGREDKPARTGLHHAIHVRGPEQGNPSGRVYFAFDPRFGQNDAAKTMVGALAIGEDEVHGFNKKVMGGAFTVLVHSPNQAQAMHEEMRKLPHGVDDLPAHLDMNGWAGDTATIVTVTNVDHQSYDHGAMPNATLLMIETDRSLYSLTSRCSP